MNNRVKVYGRPGCGYCVSATKLLDENVIEYDYINIYEDAEAKAFIVEQGFRTVPQIYIDKRHIGGYTELVNYMSKRKGKL